MKSIRTLALFLALASCHKPKSTDSAAKEAAPSIQKKETRSLSEPVEPAVTPAKPETGKAPVHDFSKPVEPLAVSELPQAIRGTDYQLVFHDEFDGPAGTPASKELWSDWALGVRKDAFNVADTCRLDGEGNLTIAIRRNTETGRIETGGVTSQKKFQATHGYFECRSKVSDVDGAWSAFWVQSPTIGNPLNDATKAGVEIDVLECFSGHKRYKDTARHTAHWDGYGKDHKHEALGVKVPGITENFHTYAVKWDEQGYVFFIDGVESGR
ncbi:MAG TPA: glycoside hydrolase family 16 protein, partial [Luteolibacter sp.]